MYNTYGEMMALKDLFTSKPDADKLYRCIQETKSGCLLRLFDIKILDKMTPWMIMKLMSTYKSDVIGAYNHKTKHKILQSIIDYCSDAYKKPEQIIKIQPKDLDWLFCVDEYDVCDAESLQKNRFELSKASKDLLITKGTYRNIEQFKNYLSDKDLAKAFERNVDIIRLIKKPTPEMLRKYWDENKYDRCMPVVDNYPLDLLVEMCERRGLSEPILQKNERFGGLLQVFYHLCMNSSYDKNYGIEQNSDDELKNYAQLVDNDTDLLKQYVKEKLLALVNKA